MSTITWNGSSKRLIATEFSAGEAVLASIDVDVEIAARDPGVLAQVIWANNLLDFGPGDAGISLSKDAATSAVIRQSYTSPPEVETGAPGKWKPITQINRGVQPITGKAQDLFWKRATASACRGC